MSAIEFSNELRGVLFKNDKKRPDKQDADYRGSATIGGVSFWIDAWVNITKSDPSKKHMSLKFKEKDSMEAPPMRAAVVPAPLEFDDAIPF